MQLSCVEYLQVNAQTNMKSHKNSIYIRKDYDVNPGLIFLLLLYDCALVKTTYRISVITKVTNSDKMHD